MNQKLIPILNIKRKSNIFCSNDVNDHNKFELPITWIIIYNLYQLHIEIMKQTINDQEQNEKEIIHQNIQSQNIQNQTQVNSKPQQNNYFAFEEQLQKWIVNEHNFHFQILILRHC